jgi:hypothetical protein
MQKLLVTMKDIQRYKVLKDVVDKKLKGVEAAELLNLTPVHVSRLKNKLLNGGFEEILRKPPPSPPNCKISETAIKAILKLRKELYYDFNIMHFMDKLHEVHRIPYCYESLRQLLIKNNLHSPKKKKKVYRQRRRMPKAGMLVQMDSSQHFWLPLVEDQWWLIAMIDDATNEIPYAQFFFKDTLLNNMHVLRRFIEIKGLFIALYVDKASHFKTTRHGGIHYNMSPEQDEETQIERALGELGINVIPANSPQAKGRIEVTFRLFQDRLIKEMRLAGVKNYQQANRFLQEKFLPYYNAKFTHEAESGYMPLPKDKNLNLVFCIKKERTVNNDNTVKVCGQVIQIPPNNIHLSFARAKVDVCLLEDKRVCVLYKGKVVAESKLSKDNKVVKKDKEAEEFLNSREYAHAGARIAHKPAHDHPWYNAIVASYRQRTPPQKINI